MTNTVLTENSDSTKITRMHFIVPTILQRIAWPLTVILIKIFCSFKVSGLHNVLKHTGKPILLISNHRSEMDPITVTAALPLFWKQAPLFYVTAPLRIFAREAESWRDKLYSSTWFFSAWGAHPTGDKTGDYAKSLQTHAELLTQHNACVLIFPEGTKVKPKEKNPKLHGGAGFLAQLDGVVTIPVSISGYAGLSMKSFLSRKHHSRLQFGEAIHIDEFKEAAQHEENPNLFIVEKVMQQVYLMRD